MFSQQERSQLRVPHEERYLLRNAIAAAKIEAGSGQPHEGYGELAYGLRRAEMLHSAGVPWARELVCRYEAALRGYCGRYRR